MIAKTLAHLDQSLIPGIVSLGLVLFLAVFIAAMAWIFRSGSTGFYGELARLPFQKELQPTDNLEAEPHGEKP
jgi:cbb3-type cytochrome oxidase subunit 3